MADESIREHKLTDALPERQDPASRPPGAATGSTPDAEADQERQAQEDRQAREAQGGVRDRLVEIGKAQHMGGRGTGRVSDS